MAFRFIVLVLPALALAQIDIYITGNYKELNKDRMHLYFSGKDVGIITNTERNTFKLTDSTLKNIIYSYFGKSPDDIFLRSPTPWGDLYKTYKWPQVTRTLIPRYGRISKVTSESVTFPQVALVNNGDKQATFSVGVSKEFENRVKTSWKKLAELSVAEKIHFDIQLEDPGTDRIQSMAYNLSWGKSTEHVQTVKIGSTSPLEVVLETGQYVSTQLNATKVNLLLDMEYEAFLAGKVAINYYYTYYEHHFWAYNLDVCMKYGKLSNKMMSRGVNEIVFYLESQLFVRDYYSNILVDLRF